jgi:hypothetical protein
MYGSSYVFSKPFFTGWVVVGIIWMFISFCIVGIYPVIEGRQSIASVCKKMYAALVKKEPASTSDENCGTTNNTEMNLKV